MKLNEMNANKQQSWAQKYAPRLQDEVLISRKSFEEMERFFRSCTAESSQSLKPPSILFLFGPSGSGKNSTVDFLIKSFGFSAIYERDLLDNVGGSIDPEEGEEKVREWRTGKREVLRTALTFSMSRFHRARKSCIVLKEVPLKIEEDQGLMRMIQGYAKGEARKSPIVVIINSTIYSQTQVTKTFDFLLASVAMKIRRRHRSLKGYSEKAIELALRRIARLEESLRRMPEEVVRAKIAELKAVSNGDLKNGINSLYLFSLGQQASPRALQPPPSKKKDKKAFKASISTLGALKGWDSRQKDYGYTIFEVLGKFLYNKRRDPLTSEVRQMTLAELRSGRPELYFSPKDVIRQIQMPPSMFRL